MRSLYLPRPAVQMHEEKVSIIFVQRRLFVAKLTCTCTSTVTQRCSVPAAEITMFDDVIVVYKFVSDLMFFVTGSQDENELILATVLQGFYESVSLLLR